MLIKVRLGLRLTVIIFFFNLKIAAEKKEIIVLSKKHVCSEKDFKRLEGRLKYFANKDAAVNLIERFFIKRGFWDCKVLPLKHKNGFKYQVDLGEQKVLEFLKIKERHSLDFSLENFFNQLKTGEPLNPYCLKKSKNNLISELVERGFVNARVKVDIKIQDAQDKAFCKVLVIVDPGQRTKFGDIQIIGVDQNLSSTLKNQLSFKQDDFWDAEKIKESKDYLLSLGLFKDVLISQNISSDSKIPVDIQLIPDYQNQLIFNSGVCALGRGDSCNKISDLRLDFYINSFYSKNNFFYPPDKFESFLRFESGSQSAGLGYKKMYTPKIPCNINSLVYFSHYSKNVFSLDGKSNVINFVFYNQFLKSLENQNQYSLNLGYQTLSSLSRKTLTQDLSQYICIEPSLLFQRLGGRWENRNGFSFNSSIKFSFPLDNDFSHIIRSRLHAAFFYPLSKKNSLSFRFEHYFNTFFCYNFDSKKYSLSGTDRDWELAGKNKINLHQDVFFPGLKDKLSLEMPNPDIINFYREGVLNNFLFQAELRLKINSYFYFSAFQSAFLEGDKKSTFFSGLGLRLKTPLTTFFIDAAFNSLNKFNWRVAIGDL